MEFRLLGSLDVAERDRSLPLGGGKQRALLADLLLHANEVVPVDRLIDELWGAAPPATVAKSVQVYVSRLRKLLGDGRLVTRPPGYVLRVDPGELDLGALRGARDEGARRWRPATRRRPRRLARGARALARPAAGRPRLRAVRAGRDRAARGAAARGARGAHRRRARARAPRELVGELEALVAEHPLRERLRGAADARAVPVRPPGRGARGLPQARAALVDELGLEPGRELRELQAAILRQDPSLDAGPARPAAPATAAARCSWAASASSRQLDGGARDGARRAGPARAGGRRAGDRQEPADRRARRPAQRRAARASSSAAAGRRAARRRTGRGCRRCAPTSRDADPTRCARSSARARPTSPSCCPSCASSSPGSPTRRAADARARASACSRPWPRSCAGPRGPSPLVRRARRPARRRRAVAAAAALRRARARRRRVLLVVCAYRDVDPTLRDAADAPRSPQLVREPHTAPSRSPG